MKYVFTILILLLSTSVLAQNNRYVDRWGRPFHAYPTPPTLPNGCIFPCGAPPPPSHCHFPGAVRRSSNWGGMLQFFDSNIGGSLYFNSAQSQTGGTGCGQFVPPSTRYFNQGGRINSWNGNVGGSVYFNQGGSN